MKTKHRTIMCALVPIIMMVIIYFTTAFIEWDFNISKLDAHYRSGMALMWVFASIIGVMAAMLITPKDE